MSQEIHLGSALDAELALLWKLRAWFEDEFGSADRWAEPDYYLLMRLEGKLAGRLGVLDREVSVDGQILRVGGIGGVATKREFRHRGVASALLRDAAGLMKNTLGVEFGMLLCRHEVSPVYAKLGWIIVPGPTTYTRAGVAATYTNDTMILPLADKAWPEGSIDLLGLPW